MLGYSLTNYNSAYVGPQQFITPLGFHCSACRSVTEIIDSDCHGYHAEVSKLEGGSGAATYRGKGTRECFRCPTCCGEVFIVIVGFVYWEGAFDLFLDEPNLPFEDFFNVFLSYGKCVSCGMSSSFTDLGKL